MTTPNEAQSAFWNGRPGEMWVRFQPDMDLLHANVTRAMLAEADPGPGQHVLDIGCGAGASTLDIAAAVGPSGQVTGCDISGPLLARARDRAAAVPQVRFRQADAQSDDLGGPFDLAVSRFGAMFFADPVAAFANIARQMRPDARLVLAAWAGAEANPWFSLARAVAEARLGPLPAGDPDAPGPTAFRDPARVIGLLTAAGLRDARVQTLDLTLDHPEGVAAVTRLAPFIGPVAAAFRETEADAAAQAAVLDDLARAFVRHDTAEGLRVPARIHLYAARAA